MNLFKYISLLIICCVLSSCYSVRLRNVNGAPQPDPSNISDDYYNGMSVVEVDTVIGIGIASKDFTYLIKENDSTCLSGKLNMVEYRNTLGGILLSAVTFGKKRKVKIKYVCEKPRN